MYHRLIDNHGLSDEERINVTMALDELADKWSTILITVNADGSGNVRACDTGSHNLTLDTIKFEWSARHLPILSAELKNLLR